MRADIDAGTTGEKVGYPDPAAAPMGTDEEAAGNPPFLEERRIEAASRPGLHPAAGQESGALYAYAGVALILALMLLGLSRLLG